MMDVLELVGVIALGCTIGAVIVSVVEWMTCPHPHIPLRERMIRNRPTAYGDQLVQEQHEWERRQSQGEQWQPL